MQDVIAGDLRRAVARDQRERIERNRRVADIAHLVLEREEIMVVDRDGAAEGEALAIVAFQHHRRRRRQAPVPSCCQRCSGRPAAWPSRPSPAPSRTRRNRVVRCPRANTARSAATSGSTVSRYCTSEMSSMRRALQRDAAGNPRRVDLDARAGGNRDFAAKRPTAPGWRAVLAAGPRAGCGAAPGVAEAVGCGVFFWSSACACCCARCCSIAGTL